MAWLALTFWGLLTACFHFGMKDPLPTAIGNAAILLAGVIGCLIVVALALEVLGG